MPDRLPSRPPARPPARIANERWKRRWRWRLGWSMLAAGVLHAGIFVASPAGTTVEPLAVSGLDALELLQLTRSSAARASRRDAAPAPIPAAPVVAAADSAGDDGSAGGSEDDRAPSDGTSADRRAEVASLSESFLERLRRRAPAPAVLEREPETEPEPGDSDPEDDDPLRLTSDAPAATDASHLPELTDLDLERMSELRPEVALTAPSGWVVVRNPGEVRRFMRRIYDRGIVDPGAAGSVSVALWIDEEGAVTWAEITDSSGREEMDRIALDLFRDVVAFWPAREEGVPVATSAIFSVVFPWP